MSLPSKQHIRRLTHKPINLQKPIATVIFTPIVYCTLPSHKHEFPSRFATDLLGLFTVFIAVQQSLQNLKYFDISLDRNLQQICSE